MSSSRPPEYPPASPAVQPSAPDQKPATNGNNGNGGNTGSIKETLESILVAFILAFIFRAFVVEAFVIPTGSMAPTLLGEHMHFTCPDCGFQFDVNYSSPPGSGDDMSFPALTDLEDRDVYCPNCGYLVARHSIEHGEGVNAIGERVAMKRRVPDVPQQPVNFGDRILVLKYAYLLNQPRRWDVIVFKSPEDPNTYHFSQNFIKRLVGLPGDTLMVLDGDVYKQTAPDQWQILRKPERVQPDLWRVIYDNDYHPQGLRRNDQPWVQPWMAAPDKHEWDLTSSQTGGRTFRFSGDAPESLTFDSQANAHVHTTNDYLVYDAIAGNVYPQRMIVADLKLSAVYQRDTGAGPLQLKLSKRDKVFTTTLTDHDVSLDQQSPDGQTTHIAGPVALSSLNLPAGPVRLDFVNVDYRVSLSLNGREVLHTEPDQYAPDVSTLLNEYRGHGVPLFARQPPLVAISAAGQACSLSHISLSRDIYYTNVANDRMPWAMPGDPVVLHHRGEPRADGSGTYDDDEYFVLGDNSLISGDARYWSAPVDLQAESLRLQGGRVPGRFILGRAFFVYWPAGFRPFPSWPPIIPNAGDMRFIH